MTNADWNLPKLPPWLMAVAPFLDLGTWTSVIYLWLGFPLGLAWFIGLLVGFGVGLPLTIIWVGFAVLAATLAGVWLAEGLERQLAIRLLGAAVPPRLAPRPSSEALHRSVRDFLGSPALWKGIPFLLLRFPFGLACWIFSLVSLVVSSVFLLAPWVELSGWEDLDLTLDFERFSWPVDSTFKLWILSFVGLVMFVVTLHLHRALGWVWARLAEWLLGARVPEIQSSAPAPDWSAPAPPQTFPA